MVKRIHTRPVPLWGMAGALVALLLGSALPSAAQAKKAEKAQTPAEQIAVADPAKMLADANRLFDAQNYEEALDAYLKVYNDYKSSFDVNRRIGWLYVNGPKRNTRAAIPYLRRAHELNPQDAAALHDLAQATAYAKLFDESIPLYREWLKEAPTSTPEPLLEFARTLSWAGKTDESIKYYQNYIDRAPSGLAARVELGQLLAQKKDYPSALEQYNYVIRFSPGNVPAHIGKAQIMAYTGQVQESLDEVNQALDRSPKNFDARVVKAYDLLWLGQVEESEKMFAELSKESPKNPDVQNGLRDARKQLQAKAAAAPAKPAPPKPGTAPAAAAPAVDELQLAAQSENQGDNPGAIAHYRAFLKQHPDNFDAQYKLARVLGWNKEYSEAETIFRKLVAKYPDSSDDVLGLARVLSWQEKYSESLTYYEKAVALHSDDAAVRIEHARVLSYVKQYGPAADEYRTALKTDPDNADALSGLAQVLIWDEKLEEAKPYLAKLEQAHPGNADAARMSAQIQTVEENEARTKAFSEGKGKEFLLSKIAADPSDQKSRLELTELYLNEKDFPKAIEQLRAASAQNPSDQAIQLQLARVLSWNHQYAESEQNYRQWLGNNPGATLEQTELARVLSWDKKYPESESQYREILKSQPDNVAVRVELARVLAWSKDYDGALKEYDAVLASDPKNYDALVGKGRIYSYEFKWPESVKAYDDALAVKPNDRDALTGKAQTLLWSGKPQESRTMLTKLNSQNGDDPVVLVALASAENSLGRPDKALTILKHADQVAPNDPDVVSTRRAITAAERPELHLGWGYLRDNETLATWRYTLDFRFNLTPRLRNFVTVNVLPTSARADFFGYPLSFGNPGVFASRVPTDPGVPTFQLLPQSSFPAGVQVPGNVRLFQNAEQLMVGGDMRFNQAFSLQAGAGFIELRHGAQDFSSQGMPSTRTHFIYSVSPTFRLGQSVQLIFSSSRQYWAFTPKAIAEEIYVDEQSGTVVLNPTSRTRIAIGAYHREVRPGFIVQDPLNPAQTFIYNIHGNGGTLTATQAIVRRERGYIEIGYDGMAFGYSHPKGVGNAGTPAEYILNTGVFTPSFYQRHAGMFHSSLKVTNFLTWDVHGSAGEQQVHQGGNFSFSSTAGSRLDINVTKKTLFSMGYDYFNAASAAQVLVPNKPAFAYHSSAASAGLTFTF